MKLTLVALLAFALGSGLSAVAATPSWQVFASGTDSGTYGGFANAAADAGRSHAVAIRATSTPGKSIKLSVIMNCQGDLRVASGALVAVWVSLFTNCRLNGFASTDYAGRVKIELLRR